MVASGLGKFKQREESRRTANVSPFFKLEDGDKVKVRPLVELDENGKHYDEKRGTANFITRFQNPDKFWLSIIEDDQEQNLGRELLRKHGFFKQKDADPKKNQHSDPKKNWNPKQRFLLPVVVDKDGEQTVEVLDLAYATKAASQVFIDFHEDKGTIMDRWFTYSRTGSGTYDTEYKFVPGDPEKFDTSKFEVPNIDDAPYVNKVPYEDQAAFLQIDNSVGDTSSAESVSPSVSEDEDW